jgi:pimeloyl-ACP methyl ester carboxylesterase
MKIYFSHGKESGPIGTKIKRLSEVCEGLGLAWESIDYTDLPDDPEARVERLKESILQDAPMQACVLVGSSMGGYVSAVVAQKVEVAGLFLLAPALYMPTYAHQDFSLQVADTTIIHGWDDELIPLDNVVRYAKAQEADLHVLPDGHRLTRVTPQIAVLFELFLTRLMP